MSVAVASGTGGSGEGREGSRDVKKSGRRRAAGLLAALVLSWLPIEAEARSAAQDDRQDQIEALSRVLGMTTAEIEAMDLSSEEMQFLLEGYTEETVVVGTRAQPRTVAESPVPVDGLSPSTSPGRAPSTCRSSLGRSSRRSTSTHSR